MRTLKLAFSRIITYLVENKTIFLLYIIGTIACTFMLIYYYGNTLTYMTGEHLLDDIDMRKFEVMFSSPNEITPKTIEGLKEFEEKYDIQDIQLTAIVNADGSNINFESNSEAQSYSTTLYSSEYDIENNDYIIVNTFLNNNSDNAARNADTENRFSDLKADIFTDENLSENVAIAPPGKAEDIKVGKTTLKVIENKNIKEYFIPSDAYFKSGIKTWTVKIWVSEPFSENMMYRYADFLRDYFDIKYNPGIDADGIYDFIYTPKIYYVYEDANNSSQFYSMLCIFIASIISFMFLLKYMMDSNRRENSVLMMVGAKKKHIVVISFIENIILMMFSTLLAIAIHALLYKDVISKANLYENIIYSVQDYAIIAMIAIGASIIIQIPFTVSYWFKNIRNLKEGSK